MSQNIEKRYQEAKEEYAGIGIDTEKVLGKLKNISLSLHCWQGDDVTGFETKPSSLSGGIQVTGNYPGKARNIDELRNDIEMVYSLLPGKHRINLHAIYGDFGGQYVDRDQITTSHFESWADWAKNNQLGIDFNATCFAHPKSDSGFTLSSKDKGIRDFWIEHVKRCREIAAFFGIELGTPSVHNLWIPDGSKDITTERFAYRKILTDALDDIYSKKLDNSFIKDSVESKLFGIGSESFVVGSHDFYMGYAITRGLMYCLDMGHFHPTESVADKISSLLQFQKELMLHVSRGIRWDSDHIVIFNDEVTALAQEIVRANALDKINIGLDFFDASVNRIGAWTIGSQATLKAFLYALLEPQKTLTEYDNKGQYFERLALLEEMKNMPFDAVWNYHCYQHNIPTGITLIKEIQEYEKKVLSKRNN